MLDARARVAMTLQAGRQALLAENSAVAMMVAEEILDEAPDDVEALELLVEAAARCGHAPLAVEAVRQLAARGVDRPALEAVVLLAAVRLEPALDAAERALGRDAADARAWAVRGQTLELLGRVEEADAALARARALDPRRYPDPVDVADWDNLVYEALSELDPDVRDVARGIALDLRPIPDRDWLVDSTAPYPPIPPSTHGGPDGERLLLFTRNLCRGAAHLDEVAERIRTVLEDEVTARRLGAP